MTIAETKSIPLFGNGDRATPQNRLASLLGVQVPCNPADREVSTEWRHLDAPFQAQFSRWKSSASELHEVAVAFFIWARIAEANNEISRPLWPDLLVDDWTSGQPTCMRGWLFQLKSTLQRLSEKCEEEEHEEERPKSELAWSKSLYKARKAVQEFSKEIHADR